MNILAVFLQIEGFPEPKKWFDGMYFCSLYMAKQKGKIIMWFTQNTQFCMVKKREKTKVK